MDYCCNLFENFKFQSLKALSGFEKSDSDTSIAAGTISSDVSHVTRIFIYYYVFYCDYYFIYCVWLMMSHREVRERGLQSAGHRSGFIGYLSLDDRQHKRQVGGIRNLSFHFKLKTELFNEFIWL